MESFYGSQFQKTSGRPLVVQSTDEDVGIKGDPHRLPRAATFLPVGVDQIHDPIFRDTTRRPVTLSFGQQRLDTVQPFGFEPFHDGLTRHFVESFMPARCCFLQGREHRPVKANVFGFGGHQVSLIF